MTAKNLNKITLSEKFISYSHLPKILKIDNEQLINHIITNSTERESDDIHNFRYNYFKVPYFTQFNFIFEYIQNLFQVDYKKNIFQFKEYNTAIILDKNESTYKHSTIDWYNLPQSPDMNCIMCLNDLKEKNYLMIDYEDGKKVTSYKMPLEKNKFILFNSELPFYITKNTNDEKNINLFFSFQFP